MRTAQSTRGLECNECHMTSCYIHCACAQANIMADIERLRLCLDYQ